jgi:hypothetical protein
MPHYQLFTQNFAAKGSKKSIIPSKFLTRAASPARVNRFRFPIGRFFPENCEKPQIIYKPLTIKGL